METSKTTTIHLHLNFLECNVFVVFRFFTTWFFLMGHCMYLGTVQFWRFCLKLRNSGSWNESSDVFWLWDRINVLRETDVFASVSTPNKNRRGFKLLRKSTNFLKVDAFVRTDFFFPDTSLDPNWCFLPILDVICVTISVCLCFFVFLVILVCVSFVSDWSIVHGYASWPLVKIMLMKRI